MKKTANKKARSKESKEEFKAAFALSKRQLRELVEAGRVVELVIQETKGPEYWLGARFEGVETLSHLTTKREGVQPRTFKRIDVVRKFLRRELDIEEGIALRIYTRAHSPAFKRSRKSPK
jgi:hypothetical protein